jgi:hypothetical protein
MWQRAAQPQEFIAVARFTGPLERGAQVIVLAFESIERLRSPGPSAGAELLGYSQKLPPPVVERGPIDR